ncbi:MAG: hypothetical protein WCC58_09420, partial [Burkholderiales bacterium]
MRKIIGRSQSRNDESAHISPKAGTTNNIIPPPTTNYYASDQNANEGLCLCGKIQRLLCKLKPTLDP